MNKTTTLSLIFLSSLTTIGCSPDDKNQITYTTVKQSNGKDFEIPIETVYKDLSTPESVTINSHDIYISNIGGSPSESLNLGFLTKNGKKVLTGLDDPKGMAIIADGKFAVLSDHPNIKLIDLESMSVVQTLPVDSAGFLNDAVPLSEKTALVSDTGTGNVYKVEFSNQSISYSTFITSYQLNGNGVNGLAFDSSSRILYLVTSSFGGNPNQGHIYKVSLDSDLNLVSQVNQLIPSILGNGNLDGIAVKDGKLIISDWENDMNNSSIFIFDLSSNSLSYVISGNFNSAADIALDDNKNLYIPEFKSGIVAKINLESLL
ncbi:hypothetical protein IHC87_21215 (plasmid) [Photobacterium damselae subsp. damselae]|uniref:hypothetical protein n=1 Tax=Photobacterium damselae TaxID=38293 RepID=UPI001F2D6F4F|nr:hypothetical protein [Photobacterium damselae]UJZ96596.1 hypothetical protein IHC87_21215 [Photobacterium damselae subsp. damselae]UKA00528.1 hypothetical protein IHC88_21350 [Photobacterium damselae subsp. damselae]